MQEDDDARRGASTRRFFRVLAAGLIATVALGAMVATVDPYLYFDAPRVEGFNRWKTRFFFGQYDSKARLAADARPRHLLIGTSTVAGSLRPDHPLFNGEPTFNYALAGSTPRLQGMALAHAMEAGTLRSVIIGVDLFAYNAFMDQRAFRQFELAVEQGGGLGARWRRTRREIETLVAEALSYESIADAFGTVREQRMPSEGGMFRDMREDGFWQNPRPAGMPQARLFDWVDRRYLGTGWFPEPARAFAFDDGRGRSTLGELRGMLQRASSAGLDVTIAIMPFHARLGEAMHEAGLWDDFEELKRRIVALGADPQLAGLQLHIWDFSGYHSLSMDPVKGAAGDTRWFEDSIHPSSAIGDLVLRRIQIGAQAAGEVPADFGRLLEPANIDAQFAASVARRAEYLATREADVAQVRRIAQKTAAYRAKEPGTSAD